MTIFYRVENTATACFDINELVLSVESTFTVSLPQDKFICENAGEPVVLETEAGYTFYEWSTGESGSNLNSISINEGGDYWVDVTATDGCKSRANTTVAYSSVATINDVIVSDFRGRGNTITVMADGPGDYHYLLDDLLPYTDEHIFEGVARGYHTVYVRDKKGCGVVSAEVIVLDYPRFFTPNGDGINDYWQIEGIEAFPGSKILIFNRFGRVINGIRLDSKGWDGTDQNGVAVAANDYWFAIIMVDGREIRGHFTLKR
jgi:gliding motility-associated-like protein